VAPCGLARGWRPPIPGLGLQQITGHRQSTGITPHLHPQLFKTHLDMQLLNCMISKCRSTAKQAQIKKPSTDEATAIPSSCYGCTHQTPPWPPSHPLLRLPGRTWQLTHPHAEIDPPAHTAWLAEHQSVIAPREEAHSNMERTIRACKHTPAHGLGSSNNDCHCRQRMPPDSPSRAYKDDI
jgi:hypothetical protein